MLSFCACEVTIEDLMFSGRSTSTDCFSWPSTNSTAHIWKRMSVAPAVKYILFPTVVLSVSVAGYRSQTISFPSGSRTATSEPSGLVRTVARYFLPSASSHFARRSCR